MVARTVVPMMLPVLLVGMIGCAGKKMDYVAADSLVRQPAEGKALVFFVRATPAIAYPEIYDDKELIGVLSANTHIAHQAAPGKHRFMIASGKADYLDADLDLGKTYASHIVDRPGLLINRDYGFGPLKQIDPSSIDVVLNFTKQVALHQEGTTRPEGEQKEAQAATGAEPAGPSWTPMLGRIVGTVVIAGATLYAHAWIAKEYPLAAGTVLIVEGMVIAAMSYDDSMMWGGTTSLVGMAGLGVYNMVNNDHDEASKNDRFRKTLYGMPIIVVTAGLLESFAGGSGKKAEAQRVSASVRIGPDEEAVVLTWRY